MCDGDMVDGIMRDEPSSYEAYLAQYGKTLFGWLMVRTKNPADAEDLHQDILWKALNTWKLGGGSSFKSWVYLIAQQHVADWTRSRRADTSILLSLLDRGVRLEMAGRVPDSGTVSSAVYSAKLRQVVHRLSPSLRQLFDLVIREEMTDEQVADLLDMKPESVRTLRYRLIRELRRLLEL